MKKYTRIVREGPGVYCDVSNLHTYELHVALSESHVGPAMFGYRGREVPDSSPESASAALRASKRRLTTWSTLFFFLGRLKTQYIPMLFCTLASRAVCIRIGNVGLDIQYSSFEFLNRVGRKTGVVLWFYERWDYTSQSGCGATGAHHDHYWQTFSFKKTNTCKSTISYVGVTLRLQIDRLDRTHHDLGKPVYSAIPSTASCTQLSFFLSRESSA